MGIKLVGITQSKTMRELSAIFRICLTQEDLELIRFWGVSGNNC